MCTVTFIPARDSIFITSNRDERPGRVTALAPAPYAMQSGKLIFPKDMQAGGTWFVTHENGNSLVLLNGAGTKHIPQLPYRKSRGLILLDMADSDEPLHVFLDADYRNIEPFTVIAWCEGNLFECQWDGKEKKYCQLDATIPHIWSSVTLYDEAVIAKRENWFREWLGKHPEPRQKDILLFHQFTGDGDKYNDLLMDRNGIVLTVSITSLESRRDAAVLEYLDLKDNQSLSREFIFSKAILYK
jgi:hypothetical protein